MAEEIYGGSAMQFGGEWWSQSRMTNDRSEAYREARELRERGHLAKVTSRRDQRSDKTWYFVWYRDE